MPFVVVLPTMMETARGSWSYAAIATAARQLGAYAQVRGTLDRPVEAEEALAIIQEWCAALEQGRLTVAAVYHNQDDDDDGFTDTSL